jgi:hypothetical protein
MATTAAPALLPTFEVDRQGLQKLWAQKGKGFVLTELIQNAWDQDVSKVTVTFTWQGDHALLAVEDDDPNGFTDIAHAYTLFAESEKKTDAEKRGRFNIGEKLVIAVCDEASIATTTGTIHFTPDGRFHDDAKRKRGSVFTGLIPMTRDEYDAAVATVESLIPPLGIPTSFNGKLLETRKPVKAFKDTLPTVFGAELKRTFRRCKVSLYEPKAGETATIY